MKALRCSAILAAVAVSAPAQAVNLMVRSGTTVAGTLCGPWSCVPAPLGAPASSTLQLDLGAPLGSSIFLIAALPPTQCASVPTIGGELVLLPPAVVLLLSPTSWSITYITNPPPGPCATRHGHDVLVLPPSLPIGSTFVLQTLAPDFPANPFPWSFSNAIQITVQ